MKMNQSCAADECNCGAGRAGARCPATAGPSLAEKAHGRSRLHASLPKIPQRIRTAGRPRRSASGQRRDRRRSVDTPVETGCRFDVGDVAGSAMAEPFGCGSGGWLVAGRSGLAPSNAHEMQLRAIGDAPGDLALRRNAYKLKGATLQATVAPIYSNSRYDVEKAPKALF